MAWYTQRQDSEYRREDVVAQFRTLARFLDENGLTVRKLLDPPDRELDDEFAIGSDDLTEEGMELIRGGYQRWLSALDRGKSPADTTILERALAKQRGLEKPKRRPARRARTADDPPARPGDEHGSGDVEAYDKAKWHLEGDWPAGLPDAQANVHPGLYLGWAIERGLTSPEFRRESAELVEAFLAREKTGPEVFALAG
ncbi:MAG TPA: hypothetical protein VD838_05240, partial [Anaeromyxobacteraceae bacterium]|nr:hypothetical protein [Anaeromyxobacteraceae bacterium]